MKIWFLILLLTLGVVVGFGVKNSSQIYVYFQPVVPDLADRHIPSENPYQSFGQALKFHQTHYVVSSFLKVIKPLKADASHQQKWLLESEQGEKIVFLNDLTRCQQFSFNKGDLVLLAGELSYYGGDFVLKLAQKSYVEYQGKKFCEN